ncbi:4'-phosphopantetheinyl transferase superfamily protein [Hymenobacter lutimineralis]|uniref:4'-phosphopantetheinyl transferase superfamily protein n=1 Tax=Hymenobacter lutimineralis TaxID=2606448 RepID=A0A5D6UQ69_9BACT|nr:4'-phosphopantetheinyl transferase superfamily protein [Hymenobacter lutimineralis]TYZ05801.1 4'-phosphopantetheinyl transferase superfamily protein [Hymenobacter lutimineralis]
MPLSSVLPLTDHALLGLWNLTESAADLASLLPYANWYAAHCPPGRNEARTQQWLAGRALAHVLLAQLPEQAAGPLENDANGRPFFRENPELAVSLSHSGAWVAAVVSRQGRVGTDVELVRPKARMLAPRFLSANELLDAGDEALKYSLYWSAKETLYKLHSYRALVFKEQILLDPFRLREAGAMTGHLLLPNSRSQHQVHYRCLSASYVLTYCLDAPTSSLA